MAALKTEDGKKLWFINGHVNVKESNNLKYDNLHNLSFSIRELTYIIKTLMIVYNNDLIDIWLSMVFITYKDKITHNLKYFELVHKSSAILELTYFISTLTLTNNTELKNIVFILVVITFDKYENLNLDFMSFNCHNFFYLNNFNITTYPTPGLLSFYLNGPYIIYPITRAIYPITY